MLLTESFPEKTLQGLFDAFRKIPYKILWKATKENFSKNLKIPSNIQFEPWMPQLGILCKSCLSYRTLYLIFLIKVIRTSKFS